MLQYKKTSKNDCPEEEPFPVNIDIDEVREWTREAGALALRYFNNVTYDLKPDRSLVTRADIEIEQLLRERIADNYPDHGIIGEEEGLSGGNREYLWAIDPLDGTSAFVNGLPLWGVSIGLLRDGEPQLGVIYLPLIDDCYWTGSDRRAYLNRHTINVNPSMEVAGEDWLSIPSYAHRSYRISFPGKTRSLSSVAADFCYVARGSSVGSVIGRARIWDLAAGMAILHAAGGVTTMLSGQPLELRHLLDGSRLAEPLLISTPELADQIRGRVQRVHS
jgi:fructose-1,6-bisphosphatase/inositol monophosphatase family enzyme